MTAEAAAMNKHAVALAADSAVTVGLAGGPKIYNTINKLFALSKYAPVGVMIYGNAEFMAVPWETIIKRFRQKLGTERYQTIDEYANKFRSHLANDTPFIAASDKDQYVRAVLQAVYILIRNEIDRKVAETLKACSEIEESRVGEIAAQVIQGHHSSLKSAKGIPGVPGDFGALFEGAYGADAYRLIDSIFEQLPLLPDVRNQLAEIAPLCFQKEQIKSGARSGVVIAGFGEDEVYPRLRSFEVDGIVCGFLRLSSEVKFDVSSDENAVIVPFAQRDVISVFMEGLDPALKTLLGEMLTTTFARLPDTILSSLPSGVLGRQEQARLRQAVGKLSEPMLQKIQQFIVEHHVKPILSAVGVLPKDELAAMAEALVNLTSFRRRVSTDAETVGGPIDVAVISKGDGFVWIKRKHYFRPELNPGFLANYYRMEDQG